MEILKILAEDLRVGDVWLGETESTELHVETVRRGDPRPMIPWAAGRTADPIMLTPVIIEGRFVRGLVSVVGAWTLQEDQPLEVRRG